ncbi:MAG: amidase, partial [Sulfitobacter sp.]
MHVAEDEALAAACEADRANREGRLVGPLHGIPFAIKDIFDLKGWPVRWGSRWQAERIADRTAPAFQAMLDAGAIPLGLVATYELATVGPDQTSLYVQPRNPWDHAHVTGGSSSGSAAAVAAGMVRIALGTDTGGSVRSPSSYCGVVGFKPTFGAISLEGVMHLSPSLDHAGPIARTVSEAAMAFCVLTGQKQLDLRCDPKKIRIGFARSWIPTDSDGSDLLTLMDNAAASLSLAGMQIDLIELPDYATIEGHATQLILAEGHQSFGQEVVASPELFGKRAAKSIAAGGSISDETVAEAQKAGATFTKTIDDLLQDHDVLILPTVATPAPRFAHFDASETIWTEMRT